MASGFNFITKLFTATLLSALVVIVVLFRRFLKILYGGRVVEGVEVKFMLLVSLAVFRLLVDPFPFQLFVSSFHHHQRRSCQCS